MIPVIWPRNNGYNLNNFLSLGAVSLNRFVLRYSLPIFLLSLSGGVSAVGLGELRGQPALGERIQLEIDLLGVDKQKLDSSCFRLVQPAGSADFPWLKKAVLNVRKGAHPVLEVSSETPMREPIMQLAVQLGCGHEISRDYTLLASPVRGTTSPPPAPRAAEIDARTLQPAVRRPVKVRSTAPAAAEAPSRLAPRKLEKSPRALPMADRLMLSDGVVGDPSLRLATELLAGGASGNEEQREILRLEFRMLMAMHQQATSQMATAEKLRNMESTLGALQQHAAGFAQRVEKDGSGPMSSGVVPAPQPISPAPAVVSEPRSDVPDRSTSKALPVPQVDASSGLSEWSLYGVLIGTVLGLAGWLGWRNYSRQKLGSDDSSVQIFVPDVKIDPKRAEEREEPGGIDLPFEPAAVGGTPMQVDLELDAGNESPSSSYTDVSSIGHSRGPDSMMSINATTLDEHFEANPVMELADIMLSFGRVKGAAQALQEYIDNNPQEALQPWIRLMDVYRMAGMRAEFENVARNLNLHFNVEVQSWDDALSGISIPSPEIASGSPVAPRATCLEDLPRLMNTVVGLWSDGDVVGYLYQLLRDNRGGQRSGFSLPVVEDVLFLIELKETANRMESLK